MPLLNLTAMPTKGYLSLQRKEKAYAKRFQNYMNTPIKEAVGGVLLFSSRSDQMAGDSTTFNDQFLQNVVVQKRAKAQGNLAALTTC
jgi:hypothetical protein